MRIITQLTNHENKKRKKIKFESFLVPVFVLTLVVASSVYAEQSAGVLLQSGLYKENVNGELEAAIAIYERILKEFSKDRPVAAKALLHIGMCYEKMGKNEALKAYNRLVQDYTDQTGEVAEARSRLLVLAQAESPAKPPEGVTVRQVWTDWRVGGVRAVSPCGRYIAFDDWANGNLAIREIATGAERILAAASIKNGEMEGKSIGAIVFSPNSSRFAYTWYDGKDNSCALRVASLDEPKPQVLHSPGSKIWMFPVAWSPDGKNILVESYVRGGERQDGQYALVSLSDGSSRIIESLTKEKVDTVAGFSPDGKYILYCSPQEKDSLRLDVFVYTLDSGVHSRLVEHPANDLALGWIPDGRGILFVSDRRGHHDAWLLQVTDGKPQGEPRLIKSGLEQITPLGITRSGSCYYKVASTVSDIYVATLDVEAGKVVEPQKRVSLQREGSSAYADWSPDGKYLAYISEGFGLARDPARIVILTLETGEYRELSISLDIGEKGAHWSPDGRSLILFGAKNDNPSTWGVYKIDAQTGEESLLKQGGYGQPEWTPDGKGIICIRKLEGKEEDPSSLDVLYRVVIYDVESGDERELAVASHGGIGQGFALSPDGRQLAFRTFEKDAEAKSVVLNVQPVTGGQPCELTRVKLPDRIGGLEWSSDGKWVLFERLSKEKTAIWRIPADGGTAQAFDLVPTGWSRGSLSPCLHPDGRRIAFTGGATMVGDVWVMENFLTKAKAEY